MLEVSYPLDSSDAYSSDRKEYKTILNEWIGRDISIQKSKNSYGNYEFNAYFEMGESHYILEGVMEESEFINILKGLVIDK